MGEVVDFPKEVPCDFCGGTGECPTCSNTCPECIGAGVTEVKEDGNG